VAKRVQIVRVLRAGAGRLREEAGNVAAVVRGSSEASGDLRKEGRQEREVRDDRTIYSLAASEGFVAESQALWAWAEPLERPPSTQPSLREG
jgi:hypothetical protein